MFWNARIYKEIFRLFEGVIKKKLIVISFNIEIFPSQPDSFLSLKSSVKA